jgi:hypothetical protein
MSTEYRDANEVERLARAVVDSINETCTAILAVAKKLGEALDKPQSVEPSPESSEPVDEWRTSEGNPLLCKWVHRKPEAVSYYNADGKLQHFGRVWSRCDEKAWPIILPGKPIEVEAAEQEAAGWRYQISLDDSDMLRYGGPNDRCEYRDACNTWEDDGLSAQNSEEGGIGVCFRKSSALEALRLIEKWDAENRAANPKPQEPLEVEAAEQEEAGWRYETLRDGEHLYRITPYHHVDFYEWNEWHVSVRPIGAKPISCLDALRLVEKWNAEKEASQSSNPENHGTSKRQADQIADGVMAGMELADKIIAERNATIAELREEVAMLTGGDEASQKRIKDLESELAALRGRPVGRLSDEQIEGAFIPDEETDMSPVDSTNALKDYLHDLRIPFSLGPEDAAEIDKAHQVLNTAAITRESQSVYHDQPSAPLTLSQRIECLDQRARMAVDNVTCLVKHTGELESELAGLRARPVGTLSDEDKAKIEAMDFLHTHDQAGKQVRISNKAAVCGSWWYYVDDEVFQRESPEAAILAAAKPKPQEPQEMTDLETKLSERAREVYKDDSDWQSKDLMREARDELIRLREQNAKLIAESKDNHLTAELDTARAIVEAACEYRRFCAPFIPPTGSLNDDKLSREHARQKLVLMVDRWQVRAAADTKP